MKMKRYMILLMVTLVSLTGCRSITQDVNYTLQMFERTEWCNRRLNMYYTEANHLGLGIQEALYSKERANEIMSRVEADRRLIEEKLGISSGKRINVYVIETALEQGMYAGEQDVYCTLEDLESGAYRQGLVRAYYQLTEPALIHGVTDYLFDEQPDNERLKVYYSEEEDLSLLGLFGGRFYAAYNTADEIQLARETAHSLVSYLIQAGEQEKVFSENIGAVEKNAWLKSIGVDRVYENPDESMLRQLNYSSSREYPLIITSTEAYYYIKPSKYLSTVKEVETFIIKDREGRKVILDYLETFAPNNFRYIRKDARPTYYLSQQLVKLGGIAIEGDIIKLDAPVPHLHEYTHLLTAGSHSQEEKLWMQEGLADYLSRVIYPENYIIQLDFDNCSPDLYLDPLGYEFQSMQYYQKRGGLFDTDLIDARLYLDACAYATFHSTDVLNKDKRSIADLHGLQQIEGANELGYTQAASFTAYLIEHYSLETYLSYYIGKQKDETFEVCFGLSYEECKADWLAYLER